MIRNKLGWLPSLIGVVLWAAAAPAGAQVTPKTLAIRAVDRIEIPVADMDRSVKFFSEVLEFSIRSDQRVDATEFGAVRRVELQLGDERLRLTQYLDRPGKLFPADSRANDRSFQHVAIIVSDMDRAYQKLRRFKVRHASSGPQTLPDWNENAAGIRAFYFRDPDGHFLEILDFPPDKGNPKWQRPGDKLFLGIDHTAIVVADTDSSLQFYRDQLGLRIAGQSENFGVEQEHLNGVFAARLRITALRAESGPGIELLEYLSPTDGREPIRDVAFNDLVAWQIHLSDGGPAARAGESEGHPPSVSAANGAAPTAFAAHGSHLFDPDGHALTVSLPQRN
jgi:catechol 2,3-dioxygenase-like lactoylglutathione lyase family enzyme